MSDIYSFANLTYVWLGTEDLVVQTAIYNLKLLTSLSSYVEDVDAAGIPVPKDWPLYVPADLESKLRMEFKLRVEFNSTLNSVDTYHWLESASSARPVEQIIERAWSGHRITRTQWQSILVPSQSALGVPGSCFVEASHICVQLRIFSSVGGSSAWNISHG